jgi:beta-galactosidase
VRRAHFALTPATLLAFVLSPVATIIQAAEDRSLASFDNNWRFLKGDAEGANAVGFDDSSWRKLDVPHDWSIEGPFDQNATTGGAGGYLPAGIGWYRKQFSLPADHKDRRLFIEFDGVMANSEVWINGHSLGKRPFGYVSFRYDMTDHLNFGDGQKNVLAVRCDNSKQPASRWYAGAGIYRHTRLEVVDPVHLDLWPQYVTTSQIAATRATVRVQSTVYNDSNQPRTVSVLTALVDPSGAACEGRSQLRTRYADKKTIPPGQSAEFDEDIVVDSPQLWDVDQPKVYTANTHVKSVDSGPQIWDGSRARFGIREAKFEAVTGFWLNGKNLKLKGVCLHHDGGALGAAVPGSVWQRRLETLKDIGCNAIRTSHNPPAPELLDLCDKMGFVVMDETFDCWEVGKTRFDYHLYFDDWWKTDTTDTLLRDRNHPSIIIWSGGNEIHDINANNDRGTQIYLPIQELMHELDSSRPVTLAVLQPNQHGVYREGGLASKMDVVGQNYRENEIVAAHQANPEWKILGTENHHDLGAWLYLRDTPAYAGQFLWTGVDYLGEARWPNIGFNWGLVDRTGLIHGSGYQRQSWWSDKPMVHIVRRERPLNTGPGATNAERLARLYSDWTPKVADGAEVNVDAYTNCDSVELFLNDQSLGSQPRPKDNASPRQWKVPFAAGTIRAVATSDGQVVATHELRTADKPAKIVLTADRKELANNFDEVAFIRASIVDENGITVPDASEPITFDISGPGQIVAVDSADPASHELFQANHRTPYRGMCVGIVRATEPVGEITLTASSQSLPPSVVKLKASHPQRPWW